MATDEKPFKISIPDQDIDLLKQKLSLVRFPDELQDLEDDWSYGAPLGDIKRLVSRWQNGYDWRRYESKINNEVPMFVRDLSIDGHGSLEVHYIHKKSPNENAIPLLFVHGWPGHFMECNKLMHLLTSPAKGADAPSFHFVALSLPGFGFSEAPRKKGFDLDKYAETAHKLMLALGYNEYVAQGGDWGYFIVTRIASLYGTTHLKAWHTNFPLGLQPSAIWNPVLFVQQILEVRNPGFKKHLERTNWMRKQGRGYFEEQSTQPQTIGYSLADSPVGLLAWIYEKLHNWTDEYPWEDDEVLDWISLYWFSRAGPTSSLRIYYEAVQNSKVLTSIPKYNSVPVGLSYFPKELYHPPKAWSKMAHNVVQVFEHDKGGHFAAYEQPESLANDVRKFFGKGGAASGLVKGLGGY